MQLLSAGQRDVFCKRRRERPQANHIPWTLSFHFITWCDDTALQAELERYMPGLWVVRSGGHFLPPHFCLPRGHRGSQRC